MINREIIYDRNLTGSYMKIPVSFDAKFDEKMMLKRKLPGLLPVEKCYVDGQAQYWYNISGRQSLDTYCHMKSIGKNFIEQLIISICAEIEILERNLLSVNNLLLDPEFIYVTNSNQEFIFTIYPGAKDIIELEFQQLMEYLLGKIDHKEMEAVHIAYSIYEKTLNNGYSIIDIRDSILESKRKVELEHEFDTEKEIVVNRKFDKEEIAKEIQPEVKKKKIQNEIFEKMLGIWEEWKKKLCIRGAKEEPEQESYTEFYESEEIKEPVRPILNPTICLSDYRRHPKGELLYEGAENFSNIQLKNDVSKIGQGIESDIVIRKDTISRFHARIVCENEEYYLEDLNSTNGTYINEEMLPYKERRKLNMNDSIRFADVKYRFI